MLSDDTAKRMVEAAIGLAGERGWRDISLADVAARGEVPLADAYRVVPSKAHLLARVIAATDLAVLDAGMADRMDTPRDRLFEVLMRRFDQLQARRRGMVAILRDVALDPVSVLCALPQFGLSLGWMLEAAGISSAGPLGALRVKGLAVVYLGTLRVWLDDETADMARTMAALDKNLMRAEQALQRVPWVGRLLGEEGGAPAAPPPPSDSPPPATASTPVEENSPDDRPATDPQA